MENIQISFDEKLLSEIDRAVSATRLSRSEIVNEAVMHRLRKKETLSFETEWIEKLKQHPDDPEDAEKWIQAQTWSEK
jgi:metal-responsive CopG/Arc/MetJ family transcriptional regulator